MAKPFKRLVKNVGAATLLLMMLWCLPVSCAPDYEVYAAETEEVMKAADHSGAEDTKEAQRTVENTAAVARKPLTGEETQGGYTPWRFDVSHNRGMHLGFCAQKGLESAASGTYECREIQNDRLKAVLLVSYGSFYQDNVRWTSVHADHWIDVMHGTITYAYTGDRVRYNADGSVGTISYFNTAQAKKLADEIYAGFPKEILDSYTMYESVNPNSTDQNIIWLEGVGQIRLQKIDGETGENRPQGEGTLSEAVYDIFDGNTYQTGDDGTSPSYRESMITDTEGLAKSSRLPLGKYLVIERQASFGYLVDPTVYEVTLSENSQAESIYTEIVTSKEQVIREQVEVVKTDAGTGRVIPIEGVRFRLLDANKNPVLMEDIASGGNIESFVTDETGRIVFPQGLLWGIYYLEEIDAPAGYLKGELLEFRVEDNQQEGQPIAVIYADENAMGQICITKLCAETERPLDGAVFEIRAAEEIVTPDGTVRLQKGELADTVITEEGKATSKRLYLGTYEITEAEPPEGYLPNREKRLVELKYKDHLTPVVTEELTIRNQPEEEPPEPEEPPKPEMPKKSVKTGDEPIGNLCLYLLLLGVSSGIVFLSRKYRF